MLFPALKRQLAGIDGYGVALHRQQRYLQRPFPSMGILAGLRSLPSTD